MNTKKRGKNPSIEVQRELWAKSGGVCQYPGCGIILYQDGTVFWVPINLGEVAHNVGASMDGPRGDNIRSHKLSVDPENLLMLCRHHHKTVDALDKEYREETLKLWKKRHETQVLAAAQLTKGEVAVPIICRATQIGGHEVYVDQHAAVRALIEHGMAPVAKPQEIVIDTQGQPDNTNSYWATQVHTVREQVRFIRSQMQRDCIDAPLAIFPLAEMPVLMALGHAIGDKSGIKIFQFSRHSGSWAFPEFDGPSEEFSYDIPSDISESTDIALELSLSATINPSRIKAVFAQNDIPIVRFKTNHPSTELVRSPKTIEIFRQKLRQCLTDIETKCDRHVTIHVFPAMPASLATAFGCCIMPKVSNPIIIYDAKNKGGGFRKCLNLPLEIDQQNKMAKREVSKGE